MSHIIKMNLLPSHVWTVGRCLRSRSWWGRRPVEGQVGLPGQPGTQDGPFPLPAAPAIG